MKAFANPVLLLVIVIMLAVQVQYPGGDAPEVSAGIAAWVMTLCAVGLLVNGVLAISRSLARRGHVMMPVLWSCFYLVLGSTAWVLATNADDEERADSAALAAMLGAWPENDVEYPFAVSPEHPECLLVLAARAGSAPTVERVLAQGNTAAHANELHLAAMAAAEYGRTAVLPALLNAGVAADAPCQGTTVLHAAVVNGKLKAAQLLLQAGAKADAADADGYTPLMHAALNEDAPMVKLLLEHGADPALKNPQDGRDAASMTRSGEVEALLTPGEPADE